MKVATIKRGSPSSKSDALLQQLFSGRYESQEAWKEFLRQYSNLFLKIIWQFEKDRDAVMEKYLYVCSKLATNEFAILRSFNPERRTTTPKLSTWLTIVVKNLCFEAHRVSHGRRRFPRALLKMSEFDRKVFDLYYWRGYSPEQVDTILASESGGEEQSAGSSLARIDLQFTKPARTSKASGKPVFISYDEADPKVAFTDSKDLDQDDQELVNELLLELTELERAVLHLRFWGDVRVQEISQMLNLKPTRRVYSIIQAALTKLRHAAVQDPSP